jgi:hypothetical protein
VTARHSAQSFTRAIPVIAMGHLCQVAARSQRSCPLPLIRSLCFVLLMDSGRR